MSSPPRHVITDYPDSPSPLSFSGSEDFRKDISLADECLDDLPVPVQFRPGPYTLTISESPHPWSTQCGCGGIGYHNHQTTMNGAGSGETSSAAPSATTGNNGPMPNYVQVAKSYIFEQEIQLCLRRTGVSQAREDNIRLAGVQWIDNVRRALKL